MRLLINMLIGPCQSSFLKNRQVGHNAIIVQEITNYFRKVEGRNNYFMMKIDLKKAFDKLEWPFICNILVYFNFPMNIINLIMSCICTSSSSILINGSRSNFFSPSRGIRQGDPISPYIFILCMEVLSHNISDVVSACNWNPVYISKRGPPLSHLFFADDLVLM